MGQKFQLRDMKGLTPAVDPTVSDEIFLIDASNVVFDSRGPRSVFGDRLLLPQPRSKPEHTQGIRLKLRTGDRCFTIDGDGIWEWDEEDGGWQAIFLTPDTTLSPYRWTFGYLADRMYFCHPVTGILVYNLDTDICLPHVNVGVATPNEALALTVNNGRLCVTGPQFFSWSNPSDGLDFTPKLGGGGFQLISDRVPGNPIMITSYAGGCLTWTTGGVMRSEFAGDAAVYRHRSLNTEYRPVNSFCTARLDDDTTVVLDERGLFQSKGESITPYAPVFNEFLIDYIQRNNLRVGENLRIEWDELQRRLYVSVSLSYSSPIYETAFVLYPPLDKWGQFNQPHYGIIPLLIKQSERADDYYGFVDSDACVRYWLQTGSREKTFEESNFDSMNLYYPTMQKPVSYIDSDIGRIMNASGKANTIATNAMTQRAGYYFPNITTPVPVQVKGLDSKIVFGLFRPTGPVAPDQMSEISSIMLRSVLSGPDDITRVDYNTVPDGTDDEDYNEETGREDFGFENLNFVNHKLRLIGTVDGVTEYMTCVPDLVQFNKAARYYSCSNIGVWHMVEVKAVDIGESYHLETFEFNAIDAGRMM